MCLVSIDEFEKKAVVPQLPFCAAKELFDHRSNCSLLFLSPGARLAHDPRFIGGDLASGADPAQTQKAEIHAVFNRRQVSGLAVVVTDIKLEEGKVTQAKHSPSLAWQRAPSVESAQSPCLSMNCRISARV